MRTGNRGNHRFPGPPGIGTAEQNHNEESLVYPGSLFCCRSEIGGPQKTEHRLISVLSVTSLTVLPILSVFEQRIPDSEIDVIFHMNSPEYCRYTGFYVLNYCNQINPML